ncbi:MAG: hypothetical protein EAZ87_16295 [Nostocales cyanobacterium]|nr:MAG: hypothetical protein EAZ87_16295 [Nostocales cyanobacterium]
MKLHRDLYNQDQYPKRKRGVILSSQGWQKLQAAEYLSVVRENGGIPYTLEKLSEITGISAKTLTKVRKRQSPIDQPTLASYFEAFGLSLEAEDYIRQDTKTHTDKVMLSSLLQAPLKGQLPLDSPFYLYRPPAEKILFQEIYQPGALIRIRAPRQFGKTSLIDQCLNYAQENGFRSAVISLQLADSLVLGNLNQFLQWLCLRIGKSLNLPNQLTELWNPLFGSSYSCTDYFESCFLSGDESPLLLILDEVNVLFNYPEIATDFFGMLRAWYEQARHNTVNSDLWQRLRLVIVYSTEVFLPLNIHQSPFNVGLLIELPPFNLEQVRTLAIRYGLEPSETYAQELINLVGGNPYLTQLALFHLYHKKFNIADLSTDIMATSNIFNSHLRQQLAYLEHNPELEAAMQKVVIFQEGVELHPQQSFKLQGLGLIKFDHQLVIPSCSLYQQYFSQVFS